MNPVDSEVKARASAAMAVMEGVDGSWSLEDLEQLEGGWSRHSWTLGLRDATGARREFIVRVKPPGGMLATSIEQEFRIYSLLQDEPIPTPAVHGLESNPDNAFGGPFFVMDKAPGRSPNAWRRQDREANEANWRDGGSVARDLVSHLAHIHSIGFERVQQLVEPRDFQANLAHWQAVYERARLVRDPIIEEAYAWVAQREPEPQPPCLVHGDYRPGNCLIQDGRLSAILDWELSFFGDPRFDLGYLSLEYTAGKMAAPGSPLLAAVADHDWFYAEYERLSGRAVDRDVVRTFSVMSALMLISILTTGLRMYADGHSTDARMVWLRFAIPGLRQDITKLMNW
ncbi:MAG TPA: phosphotransferase family protein [Pseudonocardia sp.]|jgi:aminoglycoside phosphotransferase (APT) family kinase protein|nr:phosphotransferase family protein [Pseudonocardia sp.]